MQTEKEIEELKKKKIYFEEEVSTATVQDFSRSNVMPFCSKTAKKHYKGLTIDEILRMVYNRLKLHVGSNIDLA